MKTNSPHIGILGLGSRSTLFYLETLNKNYQKHLGEYHTFPCFIYNVDFNSLNPFLPNNFGELIPILQAYLEAFNKLAIDTILIPNITLHETFNRCNSNLKSIHPLQLSVDYLIHNGISKVTLFGSLYTMESDYISTYLKSFNIEVVIPNKLDRFTIDAIRKKVYNNEDTGDDKNKYQSLLNTYLEQSYVLVSCTELSILCAHMHQKKIVDMAQLQIDSAINFILLSN